MVVIHDYYWLIIHSNQVLTLSFRFSITTCIIITNFTECLNQILRINRNHHCRLLFFLILVTNAHFLDLGAVKVVIAVIEIIHSIVIAFLIFISITFIA